MFGWIKTPAEQAEDARRSMHEETARRNLMKAREIMTNKIKMTRDEAIQKILDHSPMGASLKEAERLVDTYVALGMLELAEEPIKPIMLGVMAHIKAWEQTHFGNQHYQEGADHALIRLLIRAIKEKPTMDHKFHVGTNDYLTIDQMQYVLNNNGYALIKL